MIYAIERSSERRSLDVYVRILRSDGSTVEGQCVDASDEGFGVTTCAELAIGEIVRLSIGRSDKGPSFLARVVWQNGSRAGLYCVASND